MPAAASAIARSFVFTSTLSHRSPLASTSRGPDPASLEAETIPRRPVLQPLGITYKTSRAPAGVTVLTRAPVANLTMPALRTVHGVCLDGRGQPRPCGRAHAPRR